MSPRKPGWNRPRWHRQWHKIPGRAGLAGPSSCGRAGRCGVAGSERGATGDSVASHRPKTACGHVGCLTLAVFGAAKDDFGVLE